MKSIWIFNNESSRSFNTHCMGRHLKDANNCAVHKDSSSLLQWPSRDRLIQWGHCLYTLKLGCMKWWKCMKTCRAAVSTSSAAHTHTIRVTALHVSRISSEMQHRDRQREIREARLHFKSSMECAEGGDPAAGDWFFYMLSSKMGANAQHRPLQGILSQ